MKKLLATVAAFYGLIFSLAAFPQSVAMPGPGLGSFVIPITYATWDAATIQGTGLLTNGNLTFTANQYNSVLSTIGKSTGKPYWEVHADSTTGSAFFQIGISQSGKVTNTCGLGSATNQLGYVGVNGAARIYACDDSIYSGGATFTTGDYIGIAADPAGQTYKFYKNCSLQYTISSWPTGTYYAAVSTVSAGVMVMTANFGASPFHCTVPAGYDSGLY